MTLPLTRSALVFYSQRIDGRPYVNCLPYSICTVLRWMGYDVPATYGMTIRKASGVPVAEHRGTSYADMRRALGRLLPNAPVEFASVPDADMLARLPRPNTRNRTKAVFSITVRMHELPRPLRRHVGYDWVGTHAVALGARRIAADGTTFVLWLDPMGRTYRGYAGDWIEWTPQIAAALIRGRNGGIKGASGVKRSARP